MACTERVFNLLLCVQHVLTYPSLSLHVSGHLDYPNTKATVLLEYSVISMRCIRVNACIATKLNELQSEEIHLSEMYCTSIKVKSLWYLIYRVLL